MSQNSNKVYKIINTFIVLIDVIIYTLIDMN